jgi:hypothetical protein
MFVPEVLTYQFGDAGLWLGQLRLNPLSRQTAPSRRQGPAEHFWMSSFVSPSGTRRDSTTSSVLRRTALCDAAKDPVTPGKNHCFSIRGAIDQTLCYSSTPTPPFSLPLSAMRTRMSIPRWQRLMPRSRDCRASLLEEYRNITANEGCPHYCRQELICSEVEIRRRPYGQLK